jgi:hypothetical protein
MGDGIIWGSGYTDSVLQHLDNRPSTARRLSAGPGTHSADGLPDWWSGHSTPPFCGLRFGLHLVLGLTGYIELKLLKAGEAYI